jgi:hypothetical protein
VPTHPQPRMQSKKAYELVTTGKAGVPGIPARDGFNGFLRDLPGDRLCCHRRLARLSAKLDASVEASGPHDFAVRVQHRSSAVLTITSIASRPASVTIASAPRWDETAPLGKCFASERKQDIFSDWAGQVICETAWPSSMRARTQLSLRAQRSNPASEPQSWIASSLRSSQ